jgi:hypothetical protein
MITVKKYPVMEDRSSASASQQKEDVVQVKKMVAEYRLFGILLLRKELITPANFGVKYYDNFIPRF